jgi:hypothetical protein
MDKKYQRTKLARERLLLLAAIIEVVNKLLDLLSKFVNYASPVWKLRI